MNEDPGENFLARWSRRKRQPHADGDAAGEDGPTLAKDRAGKDLKAENGKPVARQSEPVTGDGDRSGDPNLAGAEDGQADGEAAPGRDFSDVDFEKLDFESDYTTFMEKDVPDDVRNLALRKLWASNPVLTFMDGLDDYCEDYTDAAVCMPAGTMKTAYKFGRGFLNDEEVAEWEALGKPEEPASDEQPDVHDKEQAPPGEEVQSETVVANAEPGAGPVSEASEAGTGAQAAGETPATEATSALEVASDESRAGVPISIADAKDQAPVAGKA